jgi:hypothetical protein
MEYTMTRGARHRSERGDRVISLDVSTANRAYTGEARTSSTVRSIVNADDIVDDQMS